MVGLRRKPVTLSVFKNLWMTVNGLKEVEVMVALLDIIIGIRCEINPGYSEFMFKSDCVFDTMQAIDTVQIVTTDGKCRTLFGSKESKANFCASVWNNPGHNAPPLSPKSSQLPTTPSPTQSLLKPSLPDN